MENQTRPKRGSSWNKIWYLASNLGLIIWQTLISECNISLKHQFEVMSLQMKAWKKLLALLVLLFQKRPKSQGFNHYYLNGSYFKLFIDYITLSREPQLSRRTRKFVTHPRSGPQKPGKEHPWLMSTNQVPYRFRLRKSVVAPRTRSSLLSVTPQRTQAGPQPGLDGFSRDPANLVRVQLVKPTTTQTNNSRRLTHFCRSYKHSSALTFGIAFLSIKSGHFITFKRKLHSAVKKYLFEWRVTLYVMKPHATRLDIWHLSRCSWEKKGTE